MSQEILRICLWSGPRNISTALMYSFAQRDDTVVYDEPLYAHYLSKTPAREYHPGAEEVIATMENDGEKVVHTLILGDHPKPVAFFKQMTHHLLDLDLDFLSRTVNILLTRDPVGVLTSFAKRIDNLSLGDVGYKAHLELLDKIKSMGQDPPVLDSNQVLLNPKKVLGKLCERIGIPFQEEMLSWEAGARPEDGSWSKYWYRTLHQTTGFVKPNQKSEPFPEAMKPLLEECQPYYEQLSALAIQA
ncbi:MAG: hypothetical protein PVJ21_06750 [Anaerolineales bacterium]|jgi:hypothetical protein